MTGTSPQRGVRDGGAAARLYRLFVPPLRALNARLRQLTAATHHLQYKVAGFLRPSAEWFDHENDAKWQWAPRGGTNSR
jgi:hypothetical protein